RTLTNNDLARPAASGLEAEHRPVVLEHLDALVARPVGEDLLDRGGHAGVIVAGDHGQLADVAIGASDIAQVWFHGGLPLPTGREYATLGWVVALVRAEWPGAGTIARVRPGSDSSPGSIVPGRDLELAHLRRPAQDRRQRVG